MNHLKTITISGFLLTVVILVSCGRADNKQVSNDNDSSLMNKPDAYWKKKLTKEQYYILREKGTEAANSGTLVHNKESGIYTCAGCGNALFSSQSKFESNTGWPSFDAEIAKGSIILRTDNTYGMSRTEVVCGRCGGHLGHLFDDGPTSTGKRYCMNSDALQFQVAEATKK